MSKSKSLSRRTFLAASTAPLILTSCVTANGKRISPNDKIQVSYIGVGRRAQQLMNLPPDCATVAYSDVNTSRLAEMKKNNPDARVYRDYREMLEQPGIDAVVVASPDHWHAIHSVHAMEAGKDVYVEKPMTLTIDEGKVMVAAAEKTGRVLQVGSQQRSDPPNRIACELIRNGRIGKVHMIHGANYQSPWECPLPPQPVPKEIDWDMWCGQTDVVPFHEELYQPRVRNHEAGWISYRPYSGGEITGWGAHGLDQVQWALGIEDSGPVEVWPHPDETPPADGEHMGPTCPVSYRFADGAVLKLDGQGPGGGALFEGENGSILLDRGKFEVVAGNKAEILAGMDELAESHPADDGVGEVADADGWVHLYNSTKSSTHPGRGDTDTHMGNWAYCIRSRKPPIESVSSGHHACILCHLGNIARWTMRPLQWNPDAEEFVNDPEANAYLKRGMREGWGW